MVAVVTTVLTPTLLTFVVGWIVATATAVVTLLSVEGGNLAIVVRDGVSVRVELSSLPHNVTAVAGLGGVNVGVGVTESVSWRMADLRMVCCNNELTSIAGHATSETLRHKTVSKLPSLLCRWCLL